MAITIETQGSGTVFFRTVSPTTNSDGITGSFFDASSFGKIENPIWITNNSFQRDGGFKHFAGRRDASMNVLLHLSGTSRYSDLNVWKKFTSGTVFYLNFDSDYNLNGNYVITSFIPKYFPQGNRVEVQMQWEGYNN